MKVDVLNIKGEKSGRTIDLPDNVFGVEPNEHVMYLAVKVFLVYCFQWLCDHYH